MNHSLLQRRAAPRRATRWAGALGLGAALLLSACGGGGSDDTAQPQPEMTLGEPVSKTLGATGGSVELTTWGVKVTVTVPKDALAADTPLRITPEQPRAGDSVRLKFEPVGTVFSQPVSVLLEYPAGHEPNAGAMLRQTLGANEVFVATSVNVAARTLSAQLRAFGGSVIEPLHAGRAQALRAKATADPAPDDGSLSAQDVATIPALVDSANRHLTELSQREEFQSAIDLQLSMASLLQRSGQDGFSASAEPFIVAAHTTACTARQAAIDSARASPIQAWGDYKRMASKILYWEAAAQAVGGDACAGGSAIDAVHDIVGRELTFVSAGLRRASAPAAFESPAGDVKDARLVAAQAQALQFIGMRPMMESELIEPALVPAREAAWNTAKETGSLAQYLPLLTAFGPVSGLQQDVQYVNTTIRLQSRDDTNYLIASQSLPFAHFPDLPAEPARTAQAGVRSGGTIQLSGRIAVLQCPNSGAEQLKISFDGVEVASLESSGDKLLSDALVLPTFTPAALLARVGLPATDTGSHTLVVQRVNSACAATLGLGDDVLFTITLDFGAAEPPLKKFQNCGVYFQGNAYPVQGGLPVTGFQLQLNGNTGVYMLYMFPVDPITFQMPDRFFPGEVDWPDGTSPNMSGNAVGKGWNFGGAIFKFDLSFSVDAQNRHRLTGTITGFDSDGKLTAPFNVDATCSADIH